MVAQTTTITGIVTDSITEEPLSSISVFLKGTTIAVMTDSNGRYTIRTSRTDVTEVGFTSLGYREKTIPVKMGGIRVVNASLCPSDFILQEIDVRPKKERYSRKNNPAVDFVRNLISRRDEHNPENHDYYSYDQYDKMTIALNDFSEEKKEKKIFSKFQFLFDFVDTSEITGKPILTVSIREKISKCYYRKNPESHRQKVNGIYHEGIDEIFSKEGIAAFYNEIFKEIDIFQNNISIMLTRFVSPLSTIGPAFYKYYLGDTVIVDGEKCLKLLFVPFNAESAGFVGNMYVTLDSTYFVKNLSMAVPKNINLNYVEDLIINQEFTRTSDGTRIKTKDDMVVEFQIMPGTPKLYTRRLAMYRGHSFDPFVDKETLELFNQEDRVVVDDMAEVMPASFWDDNRQVELKTQESLVGQLLEKLRSIPVYYWLEKIIKILITGYIETGHEKDMSKFDIGPMNTTLSYNSFEGLRMRVGGFTTANLNKHWFWKGYVAFGTRDHRVKYSSRVEYSFPEKDYSPAEYKVHSLALTHTYDVNQLGQQYEYTNKDNIFLSLKRKSDIRTTYLQNTELSYQREHDFGLSYGANLRYKIEESTKYVTFTENSGIDHKYYHWAEAEVHIRYAPHEKFYQSKGMRYPINRDAPILMLSHTFSPKNFLGSKFMINRTDITFAKDVWFSAFGHIESAFQVSHVWNQAPYTMLIIPNANLSYTIQEGSYSLLSPMEFVFDSYASWDVSYYANGLIFNRIPYLKVLRLREVFTFKGFFGNLSDKNNPYKTTLNPHLWSFSNKEGEYIADGNNKTLRLPYMEIAAGLDNVFKILQIEYVHRLTYRDHQNVSKHGIRIALHFSF
ncbi:MAG: DUF5686 and carboxypeptidase regulatory-like domain-containing protein [Porphyromonadaceae bacterium]|nr:DUF5686 and carboxypeptidase regulatory-like domain-containing protein [Porphyromonadaceae bacterium]